LYDVQEEIFSFPMQYFICISGRTYMYCFLCSPPLSHSLFKSEQIWVQWFLAGPPLLRGRRAGTFFTVAPTCCRRLCWCQKHVCG